MFDSGSTTVDAKATSTIKYFVEYCRPISKYRVALTGHTDTAGSAAYNMALSLRRAEVVKQALVREGVPAEIIVAAGRGETQLLVQTGDGVKEPQNRRVELVCH
jgi:outer membrane protein OmpA-like peptidoglycan-associated protein